MVTLQIPLSKEMQQRHDQLTKPVGISNTAYIKILVARDLGLLPNNDNFLSGNLFNANRDNNGEGLPFSKVREMLQN